MIQLVESLDRLKSGDELKAGQMQAFMEALMEGQLSDDQIIEFLLALKTKGETVQEIVEAASVMRRQAVRVKPHPEDCLDTCGTGGDARGTLNVSTMSALIAAAAGVPVAKHGNRAISSASGSADFLSALGIAIELQAEEVVRSIDETGFGFMFAPLFHPSMKYAASARKKMKTRTIFNCLGPLTNPAGVKHQLMGVYDAALVQPIAQALGELGGKHVLTVHGAGGLDEVSTLGETQVAEWCDGRLETYTVTPEQFGLKRVSLAELQCENANASVQDARDIFSGKKGAKTDFAVVNAAFALKAADRVTTAEEGVTLTRSLLESGEVQRKVEAIRHFRNV